MHFPKGLNSTLPIFHDHKLVFVHIPKNAGKSVESAFLGDRGSELGKRSRMNEAFKLMLRLTSNPAPRKHLLGSLDYTFAAQHMTLKELSDLGFVTSRTCPDYRSFAVVRNPYDRAVSSVFHHFGRALREGTRRIDTAEDFDRAFMEWLDEAPKDHNQIAHKRTQFEFLSLDGLTIGVETLIRYENLAAEFQVFCRAQGVSEVELGWAGKNNRSRDYKEYFTQSARDMLEKVYAQDLSSLKYSY